MRVQLAQDLSVLIEPTKPHDAASNQSLLRDSNTIC